MTRLRAALSRHYCDEYFVARRAPLGHNQSQSEHPEVHPLENNLDSCSVKVSSNLFFEHACGPCSSCQVYSQDSPHAPMHFSHYGEGHESMKDKKRQLSRPSFAHISELHNYCREGKVSKFSISSESFVDYRHSSSEKRRKDRFMSSLIPKQSHSPLTTQPPIQNKEPRNKGSLQSLKKIIGKSSSARRRQKKASLCPLIESPTIITYTESKTCKSECQVPLNGLIRTNLPHMIALPSKAKLPGKNHNVDVPQDDEEKFSQDSHPIQRSRKRETLVIRGSWIDIGKEPHDVNSEENGRLSQRWWTRFKRSTLDKSLFPLDQQTQLSQRQNAHGSLLFQDNTSMQDSIHIECEHSNRRHMADTFSGISASLRRNRNSQGINVREDKVVHHLLPTSPLKAAQSCQSSLRDHALEISQTDLQLTPPPNRPVAFKHTVRRPSLLEDTLIHLPNRVVSEAPKTIESPRQRNKSLPLLEYKACAEAKTGYDRLTVISSNCDDSTQKTIGSSILYLDEELRPRDKRSTPDLHGVYLHPLRGSFSQCHFDHPLTPNRATNALSQLVQCFRSENSSSTSHTPVTTGITPHSCTSRLEPLGTTKHVHRRTSDANTTLETIITFESSSWSSGSLSEVHLTEDKDETLSLFHNQQQHTEQCLQSLIEGVTGKDRQLSIRKDSGAVSVQSSCSSLCSAYSHFQWPIQLQERPHAVVATKCNVESSVDLSSPNQAYPLPTESPCPSPRLNKTGRDCQRPISELDLTKLDIGEKMLDVQIGQVLVPFPYFPVRRGDSAGLARDSYSSKMAALRNHNDGRDSQEEGTDDNLHLDPKGRQERFMKHKDVIIEHARKMRGSTASSCDRKFIARNIKSTQLQTPTSVSEKQTDLGFDKKNHQSSGRQSSQSRNTDERDSPCTSRSEINYCSDTDTSFAWSDTRHDSDCTSFTIPSPKNDVNEYRHRGDRKDLVAYEVRHPLTRPLSLTKFDADLKYLPTSDQLCLEEILRSRKAYHDTTFTESVMFAFRRPKTLSQAMSFVHESRRSFRKLEQESPNSLSHAESILKPEDLMQSQVVREQTEIRSLGQTLELEKEPMIDRPRCYLGELPLQVTCIVRCEGCPVLSNSSSSVSGSYDFAEVDYDSASTMFLKMDLSDQATISSPRVERSNLSSDHCEKEGWPSGIRITIQSPSATSDSSIERRNSTQL